MKSVGFICLVTLCILTFVSCRGSQPPLVRYDVIDLSTALGAQAGNVKIRGINSAGQIVGSAEVNGLRHAYVWEIDGLGRGRATNLCADNLCKNASYSEALSINDLGEIGGVVAVQGAPGSYLVSEGYWVKREGRWIQVIIDAPGVLILGTNNNTAKVGTRIGFDEVPEVCVEDPFQSGCTPKPWMRSWPEDLFARINNLATGVAVDVNDLGEVVVNDNAQGVMRASIVVRGMNPPVSLPDLPGGGATRAFAISNSGLIAGYAEDRNLPQPRRAVLWKRETPLSPSWSVEAAPTPDSEPSEAYAVNDLGHVVGAFGSTTESAFLWSNGTIDLLINLVTPGSVATLTRGVAINNAGEIVVQGSSATGPTTFVLSPSRTLEIVPVETGGLNLTAKAINNDGEVVANEVSTAVPFHWRWDSAAGQAVATALDANIQGSDINDLGHLVGFADLPAGGVFWERLAAGWAPTAFLNEQFLGIGQANQFVGRHVAVSALVGPTAAYRSPFRGLSLMPISTSTCTAASAPGLTFEDVNASGYAVGFCADYPQSLAPQFHKAEGFFSPGEGPQFWTGLVRPVLDMSGANAINDRFEIVGWSQLAPGPVLIPGRRATWWDSEHPEGLVLGYLGGRSVVQPSSEAFAISNRGRMVGYATTSTSFTQRRAFIREPVGQEIVFSDLDCACDTNPTTCQADCVCDTQCPNPGVMIDLNTMLEPPATWLLKEAHDINDAGQIIGIGRTAGVDKSFWLTLPDESERISRICMGWCTATFPQCSNQPPFWPKAGYSDDFAGCVDSCVGHLLFESSQPLDTEVSVMECFIDGLTCNEDWSLKRDNCCATNGVAATDCGYFQ